MYWSQSLHLYSIFNSKERCYCRCWSWIMWQSVMLWIMMVTETRDMTGAGEARDNSDSYVVTERGQTPTPAMGLTRCEGKQSERVLVKVKVYFFWLIEKHSFIDFPFLFLLSWLDWVIWWAGHWSVTGSHGGSGPGSSHAVVSGDHLLCPVSRSQAKGVNVKEFPPLTKYSVHHNFEQKFPGDCKSRW